MKYFALVFFVFFNSDFVRAQSAAGRVNLDDVKIRGDLNGNGLGFSNRSRFTLEDRVRVRYDFRPEVMENLPQFYRSKNEKSLK